ncbi:DUF6432 family protein [Halobacteriaceae archaeon GCM10025711]
MKAKREYRDRGETEVAVLDALVDRNEDGMTVFELRAHVDVEIDELERALAELKRDDLITASQETSRTVIRVDERVIPDRDPETEPSVFDWLRERLGL